MQIKDVMSKDIAYVNTKDTIEKAAQLMSQFNVGSIPVCENMKLVGIVTDRDIIMRCVSQGKNVKQTITDVMTVNPFSADPSMQIEEAAKIMSDKQVRRLPVTDLNNNLIGMLALGDIALEPQLKNNAGEALKDISIPTNTSYNG